MEMEKWIDRILEANNLNIQVQTKLKASVDVLAKEIQLLSSVIITKDDLKDDATDIKTVLKEIQKQTQHLVSNNKRKTSILIATISGGAVIIATIIAGLFKVFA